MTKRKPDKHEVWLEQWIQQRSPPPWPEPKLRQLDPQMAMSEFDAPLKPFTILEAEQIAETAGGLLPPLYQIDGLSLFQSDLNMAFSEWVAASRLDSRAIQAKPASDRRSKDRGGNARHRFIWVMLADIYKWHFGREATAGVFNAEKNRTDPRYGKTIGPFVKFVQTVMRVRGYEVGGHAILNVKREKTRRVKDSAKRKAALIKRRKRPQKGI
jgi:hypothetical protein